MKVSIVGSAEGSSKPVDDDAVAAICEAEGFILDHYSDEEFDAKLESVVKERGYIVQDEDELSESAKGEALAEILGMTTKLHAAPIEAYHLIKNGDCTFHVPLEKSDGVLYIEASAGDVVILPPKRKHRFGLTDKRYLVMIGCYTTNPGEAGPPEFFNDDGSVFDPSAAS